MFSPFSLLAADQTILTGLPTIFGISSAWLLPLVLAVISMVLGVLYGKSIRMEDHGWRVGLIGATFLGSLAIILFWPYKLGVDLKGGAILVYAVDKQATRENHPQGLLDIDMPGLMQVLKKRLNPDGLKEIVIRPFGPEHIEIVVPEVDDAEVEDIKRKVSSAGVLRFLILADSETRDRNLWDAARAQAESPNPEQRMDRNVKDPLDPTKTIGFWAGIRRNPAPGADYADFAEPGIVVGGTLLRDGSTGKIIDIPPAARGEFMANPALYFHRRQITDVQVLMVVDPEVDMRGNDLAMASESMDSNGAPCISFRTKADSVWKISHLTTENRPVGNTYRHLGIIWDGVLESAPRIQSPIHEQGQITGSFSHQEVREKVELLRSGSMPVVLESEPISDDRIGATLGAETVRSGSISIVISLVVVLAFVMFYYRTAGIIACFALLLNLMLTVALMFALKAPFTLPGLAGLVLTVGMSVDANVLIYERIREELEKGATLRMAIRNGFDKALVTIIDSNVTTLLTAVILYVIGTDQVRGFGMTLILGILTSMYTAIFVSRTILEIGEKAYRWQTMSMLKFFTNMNVDWMKLFRPAVVTSVILIAIGLVATVVRGKGIFDTDLAGGTTVQFDLNPEIYPDITESEVRAKLSKAFETVTQDGSRTEFTVYQNFVSVKDETGEEKRELVWKIDSSLDDVAQLQEVVRKAFQTPDGKEGLQTYIVKLGEITEEEPQETPAVPPVNTEPAKPAESPKLEAPEQPKSDEAKPEEPKSDDPKKDAPKTEEPKEEAPKTDAPAKEEPKGEDNKPEAPKEEEPKADAPKTDEAPAKDPPADEKKADDKPADDAKEEGSACQSEEETKAADEAKPEEKSDEPKKEEAKPVDEKPADEKKAEDKPADEPKAEPAKSEPEKTEPAATEPPKTETPPAEPAPPAETAPAEPAPPSVDAPASQPAVTSQVELNLGNGKIGSAALLEKIGLAAKTALGTPVTATLFSPGWAGEPNKAYSNWTITLPLPKAEAEKVLAELQRDLSDDVVWQSSSKIGGQVATDTQWRAFMAIVGSIFVMIVYMWIRFHKLSWGIAAAVALIHDAFIMLGAIAVSYWLAGPLGFLMVEEFKISLPVVAAFLTLIGYSVNDTIVIFDRVREIRGKSPDISGQMVNDAVNQTMSRTFLTAGTTLMVILILYFLGGSGIHAFAFSLVVGVIAGSYSTIFIASPLLVYLIGIDQESSKKKSSAASGNTTRGAA
jgi:SecD/SecF fusion protein